MSTTDEHVQVLQAQTAAPSKRLGLLALLAEAVGAARAVSTADASTRLAIATRFADRV